MTGRNCFSTIFESFVKISKPNIDDRFRSVRFFFSSENSIRAFPNGQTIGSLDRLEKRAGIITLFSKNRTVSFIFRINKRAASRFVPADGRRVSQFRIGDSHWREEGRIARRPETQKRETKTNRRKNWRGRGGGVAMGRVTKRLERLVRAWRIAFRRREGESRAK